MNQSRIDFQGPGAGQPCANAAAFNRRFRAFQRQLVAAGIALVGEKSYTLHTANEGREFYALPRVQTVQAS